MIEKIYNVPDGIGGADGTGDCVHLDFTHTGCIR